MAQMSLNFGKSSQEVIILSTAAAAAIRSREIQIANVRASLADTRISEERQSLMSSHCHAESDEERPTGDQTNTNLAEAQVILNRKMSLRHTHIDIGSPRLTDSHSGFRRFDTNRGKIYLKIPMLSVSKDPLLF
jgi:hypothetical protein